MNRKERRAVEHLARKQARKAGFPSTTTPPTTTTEQKPAPQPQKPNDTATPKASAPIAPASISGQPIAPKTPLTGIPEPGLPFPSLSSLTSAAAAAPSKQNPEPQQLAAPISPARLEANRANSKHSTGPVTPAGLAISCQNRTTHGLARHNGTFTLLASESAAGFEALKQSLADEHEATTETESILITTMAESHWLANRAQNLQASCFDPQSGQIADPKLFSLYLRYQTTHTRAFHKSLNDLLKLRAETRKADRGFEAEARKQEELRIQNEKHEMKKQTHYWDILRKDGEACFRISQNVAQNHKAAAENPGFEAQYAAELAKHGLQPGIYGSAHAAATA